MPVRPPAVFLWIKFWGKEGTVRQHNALCGARAEGERPVPAYRERWEAVFRREREPASSDRAAQTVCAVPVWAADGLLFAAAFHFLCVGSDQEKEYPK